MSELILIKTPEKRRTPRGRFPVERVVGVKLPGSETSTEYNYRPTGKEAEESLPVGDEMAERIYDFFERCRAAPPDRIPFSYDCHRFVWHALGKATDWKRVQTQYRWTDMNPVDASSLVCGEGYAVIAADATAPHSMLGISRPDHSLSVLGYHRAPLVVSRNTELLSLYDGVGLAHITPSTAD